MLTLAVPRPAADSAWAFGAESCPSVSVLVHQDTSPWDTARVGSMKQTLANPGGAGPSSRPGLGRGPQSQCLSCDWTRLSSELRVPDPEIPNSRSPHSRFGRESGIGVDP